MNKIQMILMSEINDLDKISHRSNNSDDDDDKEEEEEEEEQNNFKPMTEE